MVTVRSLSIGGATLRELLGKQPAQGAGSPDLEVRAFTIAEVWRQALNSGGDLTFWRRLSLEGFTPGVVRAKLVRGLQETQKERPSWLSLLQSAVPPQTRVGELPQRLAWHAHRFWPSTPSDEFSPEVAYQLQEQLGCGLAQLLRIAQAPEHESAWDLLARRPFLARLLAEHTEEWCSCWWRLVRRWRKDRAALEERLFAGEAIGTICEVRFGLSDRHGKGESVAHLRTNNGKSLYYKPRSLAPENTLAAFFEALRAAGIVLAPLPAMLVRPGYGWVAEVPRAHLATREAVDRWFFAAGSLAVVAWLLGLGDLHWENVVAGEEGPVIVDGEAWCRPQTFFDTESEGDLLSSGLVSFVVNSGAGLRENGALLTRAPHARSLPLFAGQVPDPREFREALLAGARDALEKALWTFRNGTLRLPLGKLRSLKIRWIARPSQLYAQFFVSLLRNPKVREGWQVRVAVETLWRPLLASAWECPDVWRLLQQEAESLERFSVPRLTLPAGQKGGLIQRSGKEGILRRLGSLSDTTVERQVALLGRALPPLRSGSGEFSLQVAAREVAAYVAEAEGALSDEIGPFLRRGWAGRALAWAAWARAGNDQQAGWYARRGLERAQRLLEEEGDLPVGFGSGLGGAVYAFLACGEWLEEPQYCELARQWAERALCVEEEPPQWDVEAGWAGLLLGVVEAAVRFPELRPRLQRQAERLREKLWVASSAPRQAVWSAGFAHGVSGVAASFARVAETGQACCWYREAALLLEQEPRTGVWSVDAKLPTGGEVAVRMNAWCHGPAGALLARNLIPEGLRTPTLEQQRRAALQAVLPLRVTLPLSMCCGSLGRSETVLAIADAAGDGDLRERVIAAAYELARNGSWRVKLGPDQGLLDGLPGLLFHLARIFSAGELGSVLVGKVKGGVRCG